MTATAPRLTVFYDGGCPLCWREIAFYRRRQGGDRIDWQDVSRITSEAVAPGLTRAAALGRFHVRDAGGALHSGGAAFAHLWCALPRFAPLGRLFLVWPFAPAIEVAYRLFLRWRPALQARFADAGAPR